MKNCSQCRHELTLCPLCFEKFCSNCDGWCWSCASDEEDYYAERDKDGW